VSDDRELVAAFLARRDEASFRRLYRKHAAALYSFAARALSASDAEEVAHETWIRACQRLADFRWESSLSTWLCGIALNRCRELRRQRDRDARDIPSPPPHAAAHGAGSELAEALRHLPEGQREILLLHDLQGFSHSEIGTLLGIEEGTSKSQLFRARRAARALLEGEGDE
jgi:RNA polymerase sigma-70 factor (ECF subfamily)